MKLAKKYLYSTILGLSLGLGMSTNVVKAAPSSNSAVASPTSNPSKDEQAQIQTYRERSKMSPTRLRMTS